MLHSRAFDMSLAEPLQSFRELGFARLGRVVADEGLAALRERADDLMLGRVAYPELFFQHDSPTGKYEDLPYGAGYVGPSLSYRKIEKLERDPLFLEWIRNALFERIARTLIAGPVAIYRAVLFTKPAMGGTIQPWHQDAGSYWGLDRDPSLQIWTALDDAPLDAGCLEVLPRSHSAGLATPLGGLVPPPIVAARGADEAALPVPVAAGEALLIHSLSWHRSGLNRTTHTRRAVTITYMAGDVRCIRKRKAPRSFVRVFE